MAGFKREADPKRVALVREAQKVAWRVVIDRKREEPLSREDELELYRSVYEDYMKKHTQ